MYRVSPATAGLLKTHCFVSRVHSTASSDPAAVEARARATTTDGTFMAFDYT